MGDVKNMGYRVELRSMEVQLTNFENAHQRDAINKASFFFRKDTKMDSKDDFEKMTMKEIMFGKGNSSGIMALIESYLNELPVDGESRDKIDEYLELITQRINGKLLTLAAWKRKFIYSHPDYKQNSIISDTMAYDLISRCHKIAKGEIETPELFPEREDD